MKSKRTLIPLSLAFVMGGLTHIALGAPSAETPQESAAAVRAVEHYNLDKKKLAIEGYDPVAYFPEGGGKPAKGKKELEHEHGGVRYRFASQKNLDAFKANPAKYEPAHGGWCSSALADGGRKVEIDPKNYVVTGDRLFLFYKDLFSDAKDYWKKDEAGNTVKADEQWEKISGEGAGGGVLSR